MAEGTYEYECSRAELLGIAPPKYEDWQESEKVRRENEEAEEMRELDIQEEKLTQNTGKMDEINNILSLTQLRLNKFKKACGSLTNLLKIRGGADGEDPQQVDGEGVSNIVSSAAESATDNVDDQSSIEGAATSNQQLKKSSTDMQQKMSSHIDKLDALLTKAENAQYSMAHQNKQMKSFLAK